MTAITDRRYARYGACALALVVLLGGAVSVAAAASTTNVDATAETDRLSPGDTTAIDVVVENADGGVGAFEATVTLSDPGAASVADVTLYGDPSLSNVTERADGVEVSSALADTQDTGRVTIATVVVSADEPGETEVDVTIDVLGDEDGEAYAVDTVDRPTLSVVADDSDEADSSDEDDEATATSVSEAVDDSDDTQDVANDQGGDSIDSDEADGDSTGGEAADGTASSSDGEQAEGGLAADQSAEDRGTVERFATSLPQRPSLLGTLGLLIAVALGTLYRRLRV